MARRVAAAVLAVALAGALTAPAWGITPRGPITDLEMSVSAADVSLSRVDIAALPVQCDPQSIQVGVPCGMTEMCGQDPCLCGRVDEYGACACNGTREVSPTYTVEFDTPGVARTVELFGTTYLVPLGEGETQVTVTAHLAHHADATATATVRVQGFGALDAAKLVGLLACAAALIAAVVFAVRGLVRAVRGLVARFSARRNAAKGDE